MSNESNDIILENLRHNFESRLSQLNQLKGIGTAKLLQCKQLRDKDTNMDATWSWTFFNLTIDNLLDIWSFLQATVEGLAEFEKEDKLSKDQVEKINSQFKKYVPVLKSFKEALDESKRIREALR
jgi:hypothetical protein